MLPVIVVGAVCGGAVTAKEKFIPLNVVRVAGSVMSQVVPLLLALGGRLEMSWLIGGAFVGNVFITSASLILCRRYFKLQFLPQFNNREVRPLLGYGSQVTLIAIVAPLLVSFDRLAISRVLNVAAVGIYSIPFMLVSKLLMLVEGASHTLFPRLASLGAGDAHRLVSQAIARLSALVTPIVILGIFWVTPFLKFWIGSEIADAARGLGEILLLGVWLNNLAKPPHVSLQASGRLRLLLVIYLLEIPIYWIVLIVLIDLHGLLGAAIAWTSRIAVDTLVMLAATGHIRSTITGQWYRATLVIAALVSAMATVPFGPMYWLALASLAFLSGIAGYAEMRATFLSLVAPNRRDADLIA
jgi:O-antigen/teichoic acid export membrane protein